MRDKKNMSDKAKIPVPASATKRRRENKQFTAAQGRRELARLDREIAKTERFVSDASGLLESLRFDRALVRGCLEIVAKL
jgi:hypothetical protein